jgi:serine/threonine protein kinase
VHRDIKPANVLLENGVERVKITDFGLARAVDDASVTHSGAVAGTPMYMSPEQAGGLALDHRSDLFSLGSILYAMCSGHPPFRAGSTHAVLKRVIEDVPGPIRELNAEIPEWLEALIAKLHAKNPDERFQTARDVAERLAEDLAHLQQPGKLGPTALPQPPPQQRKTSSREQAMWLSQRLIVRVKQSPRFVGLIALLCLLVFGTFLLRRPTARYLSNRAELEIVPQPGLVQVIVLQNDASITDWLDMHIGHNISLSPGKYRLNSGCKPGYDPWGVEWELTSAGLFGDQTVHQRGNGCDIEVQRGEHLTVRARPHKELQTRPPTGHKVT